LYQQAQDRLATCTDQINSLNQKLKEQQSQTMEAVNRNDRLLQDKTTELQAANEQLFQAQLKIADMKQENESLQQSKLPDYIAYQCFFCSPRIRGLQKKH
jgi:hypothetical protein